MTSFSQGFNDDREKTQAQPITDSIELSCSNCDKDLCRIVNVKDNSDKNLEVRCKCPFCGDTSFTKSMSGEFYISPAEGVLLASADQDGMGDSFLIRVRKIEDV